MSNLPTDNKVKKDKPKSSLRLFVKTLLISLGSFSVIIAIVAIVFFSIVRPPEIPSLTVAITDGWGDGQSTNGRPHQNSGNSQGSLDLPLSGLTAPERFTDDDRRDMVFTFLIIGLNEGRNANTVMVASYDAVNRETNLISIPRDIPVHPTRNGRKLSSSYLIGMGGGRGIAGGVAQVQRDVMTVIGFTPDFYVVIDYDAFFSIIDAVGGIEVYVPIRMWYDDPHQNLHIDIQPGLQHMDSATALDFARFRQANPGSGYPSLPDGDLGRVRNQQAVISAVIERLLRPASLLRIPEFIGIFGDSVHTNLTTGNMLWFAGQLNNIRGRDALSAHTMPISHWGSRNNVSYGYLDAAAVVELVNKTINPFYQEIELGDLSIIRE